MDLREQRGLMIAATCKITQERRITDKRFWVPSASKEGQKYKVIIRGGERTCTCPDFEENAPLQSASQWTCKHIHAVLFTIKRETSPDGTITETRTVTETIQKRTTYKQDWPAYNAAQSVEKDRFQVLLADLLRNVPEPVHIGRGRKPHSVRDKLFAMVFKVYSTISSRRFSSDLREAHQRGLLSREVTGMKSVQFMEDAAFAPILNQLVHESSKPLTAVEESFAVDSSGFGSTRSETWIDEKYGTPRRKALWVKAHVACGVKTNVVTAVRILDKNTNDCPLLPPLVKETKEGGFTMREISADKGYQSYDNFEAIAAIGAEAFIAFKSHTTGAKGGALEKAFHYFSFKREEYLEHYHKRSNVESVFSMIKRKFGGEVRSRTDAAMVNEVYCKLIAHNLCVLIQEQHELGIDPIFWQDKNAEVKVLAI